MDDPWERKKYIETRDGRLPGSRIDGYRTAEV
jgi:hypothetical protein